MQARSAGRKDYMSDVAIIPPTEDTAEEAQLRAALEQSDNEVVAEQATASEPKPPTEEAQKSESQPDGEKTEVKSDSSEPEAERTDGRDEKGRFVAKTEKEEVKPLTEGKPAEVAPVVKPDKDAERIARSWQKIQQEKTEVRSALAEIRQLKAQLQQQTTQPAQQAQPRFDSKYLNVAAEEFDRQAAELLNEGDVAQANAKLKLAKDTRVFAQQTRQQEAQQAQQQHSENFNREYESHVEAAIRENPELGDPKTEASQAMMELLEDVPELGQIRTGFKLAVEFLKARRDAASSSELRTENDRLTKENKELRAKTAISGGGVSPQASAVDFDNMTLEQQEAVLIRQARQEDFARSS